MMSYEIEGQYMLCALFLACQDYQKWIGFEFI